MRDPQGYLSINKGYATRKLFAPLPDGHILRKPISNELVKRGLLVPYVIIDGENVLRSAAFSFVTYPYEWCNSQLYDAASLSLEISECLNSECYELKDASAWNVLFDGCAPIFCDHLSFQAINAAAWWSFGQFVRHFIFPLALEKYCGLTANQTFILKRDGVSPEEMRKLIGFRRYTTRLWPLLITAGNNKVVNSKAEVNRSYLYVFCRWMLKGFSPVPEKGSGWVGYTQSRSHYSAIALQTKEHTISKWLSDCQPEWVVDLGCNTGEYTNLVARTGASVISIDMDHDSIEQLYFNNRGKKNVYPVLANIDDLHGGRGWAGIEFPSLLTRLEQRADVVFMLAFIHHLAISNSIPYKKIFELAAHISKRYIIVELLQQDDPLVIRLSEQRSRSVNDFSFQNQLEALKVYFRPIETVALDGTSRLLLLAERYE